jgi:hypothetical protein
MVNNKVMSNTHHPGNKFSVIGILAGFNRLDHFKECILKDIFSKGGIAYIKAYIGENFVLMAMD